MTEYYLEEWRCDYMKINWNVVIEFQKQNLEGLGPFEVSNVSFLQILLVKLTVLKIKM